MADAPFGKWRTQTFVAGLRCDELVAPWIIEGAMDGPTFDSDIRPQLAPNLRRGDVVILDNLNLHKSPRAAQALAERGAWFLFLPKYSPDLNPIEMAFAKLKTLLRKAKARSYVTGAIKLTHRYPWSLQGGGGDAWRGGADGDFSFIEAWREHSADCPIDRLVAEHGAALFARRRGSRAAQTGGEVGGEARSVKDYIRDRLRAAAPDVIPAVVLFGEIRQRQRC